MVKPHRAVGSLMAIVLASSCTTGVGWRDTPRYLLGGATTELATEVIPVVRTRTSEAIIQVKRLHDGTVEVQTGDLVPYQSGGGKVYVLKESRGHWQIISEAIWIV